MGKTLLLADDSVTMQKVVGITFANEDIELVTVDNGDAALERSREVRPDVVLADVGMPGLNGYDLCAALKSDPGLSNVRVILLTGTFDTYDEDRAREVGADAHVSKPFEAQALVDQVHRLLASPPVKPTAPASDEPKTATTVEAPRATPQPSRRMAPPPPPAPVAVEPLPDLDFESMELDAADADLLPEASPEFEMHMDDLPAPAPAVSRPTAPSHASPAADFADPNKTALVDPREGLRAPDLMPPDPLEDVEAGMQTTLLTPDAGGSDLFGPAGADLDAPSFDVPDFEEAEFGSSGILGDPEAPALDATPEQAPADPSWDLDEPEFAPEALDDAATLPPQGPPAPPSAMEPEPGSSTEPEFAEMVEDDAEDLELTPGEELPWSDPPQGEEPETPSFWGQDPSDLSEAVAAPSEGVPAAPARVEPVSASAAVEPPRPPVVPPPPPAAPSEPPAPAAVSRAPSQILTPPEAPRPSARDVAVDPTLIRQALEKVAWEAFGPLSEQIVREVVKKVEEIAWETLPQIAEQLVQEELARLRASDDDDN